MLLAGYANGYGNKSGYSMPTISPHSLIDRNEIMRAMAMEMQWIDPSVMGDSLKLGISSGSNPGRFRQATGLALKQSAGGSRGGGSVVSSRGE